MFVKITQSKSSPIIIKKNIDFFFLIENILNEIKQI